MCAGPLPGDSHLLKAKLRAQTGEKYTHYLSLSSDGSVYFTPGSTKMEWLLLSSNGAGHFAIVHLLKFCAKDAKMSYLLKEAKSLNFNRRTINGFISR